MSLIDKIKARPENGGKGPAQAPAPEVSPEEIKALNDELDADIQADSPKEDELTPEQIAKRSQESYEDEIKKLREENAKRRKKEQEAKEKALALAEEVFKTEREEYERKIAEMEKRLEEQKALKKEEQKVDAEIKKAETNAEAEAYRKELEELRKEREAFKAEIQARKEAEEQERALRKQAAENRFNSMLTDVPEDLKEFARAMFRGYEDPSEGLIAFTKAKTQGVFGKKTIEVVSRIPKEDKPTKEVSSRHSKFNSRVNALKERRAGLQPGDKLVGSRTR